MIKAVLIYPHQLFEKNFLLGKIDKIRDFVFLPEDPLFFTQFKFHRQKLVLHRASMMVYADFLRKQEFQVIYLESRDLVRTEDLAEHLVKHKVDQVLMFDPVDDWLERRLESALRERGITREVFDSPMFLTTAGDLDTYQKEQVTPRKIFFMKNFYPWQRRRLGILMDDAGKPLGGQWSFDTENRQKLPKDKMLPPQASFVTRSAQNYVEDARQYVERFFVDHPGSLEGFSYAVDFAGARKALRHFLEYKLKDFGPYEDAVSRRDSVLFHSVLTPYLNSGLLTPREVIDETLDFARHHDVSLASLEGFVRQMIGWREYIRFVYLQLGRKMRCRNYFQAHRPLPQSFWTATTGIEPVDHTIETVLFTAYSHHIPRLMVMGNFMNLCGFAPDEVYQWFMEMYIDAYDWVMVPNVYGMALYADGGLITTKPYIAGSNYVLKMSDYKKGDWSGIWDALFWNFVGQHDEKLSAEGRLGFIGIQYSKMNLDKKRDFQKTAEDFLQSFSSGHRKTS